MKKIPALLAIVCLALVVFYGGCGGGDNEADKTKAKELIQVGDASMEEAEADFDAISTAMEEMRETRTGDEENDAETGTENGETDVLTDEMESAAESMASSLQEAEAAYQSIISLGGAGYYKDYASVMLELISVYEQVVSMQGEMEQRMAEGGGPAAPPEGGTPPSDMTPPEGSTPPPGMTPPEGGTPPKGGGGLPGAGLFQQIEELKAEAEAIKEERNL